MVRNGYLPEREIQTGIGPVTIQIPKVRSKIGESVTFRSALIPPYVRKTKSLEAALDEIYPDTRQQRCWMHKTMNILNCLPKSTQPKAKLMWSTFGTIPHHTRR